MLLESSESQGTQSQRETLLSIFSNCLIALERAWGIDTGYIVIPTFLILHNEKHKSNSIPNKNLI